MKRDTSILVSSWGWMVKYIFARATKVRSRSNPPFFLNSFYMDRIEREWERKDKKRGWLIMNHSSIPFIPLFCFSNHRLHIFIEMNRKETKGMRAYRSTLFPYFVSFQNLENLKRYKMILMNYLYLILNLTLY